jgi:hypothetical protein
VSHSGMTRLKKSGSGDTETAREGGRESEEGVSESGRREGDSEGGREGVRGRSE